MEWELLADAWAVLVALMALAAGYGGLTVRVSSLERDAKKSREADEKQGTHRELIGVEVARTLALLESMVIRVENVEKMMRDSLRRARP